MKNNQSCFIFYGIIFAEYTLFRSIQSIKGFTIIHHRNILMYINMGINVLNLSISETSCINIPPNI
jgi:hypothetical protein